MSFNTIAGIGIILVFIVLLVIFLIPTSQKGSKKRERSPEQLPKETDWQGVSRKLEGHIHALRQDIAAYDKRQKSLERELLETKAKNKELQEKLTLEDGWIKKEQEEIEKRTKELTRAKEELKKTESSLGEEHSLRLRYERELKELKQAFESSDGQRKKLEVEVMKLKAGLEKANEELRESKRQNFELKKKQEDTQFVAKAEYDKIERLLREKEKEFQRISRERE